MIEFLHHSKELENDRKDKTNDIKLADKEENIAYFAWSN